MILPGQARRGGNESMYARLTRLPSGLAGDSYRDEERQLSPTTLVSRGRRNQSLPRSPRPCRPRPPPHLGQPLFLRAQMRDQCHNFTEPSTLQESIAVLLGWYDRPHTMLECPAPPRCRHMCHTNALVLPHCCARLARAHEGVTQGEREKARDRTRERARVRARGSSRAR